MDDTMKLFDATMRLCGANLEARAAALVNFKQAVNSGHLCGDEARAIQETNPFLIQLLMETNGINRDGVRALFKHGVAAEELTKVLFLHRERIEESNAALPMSYQEGCAVLGVDSIHYSGEDLLAWMRVIRKLCGFK